MSTRLRIQNAFHLFEYDEEEEGEQQRQQQHYELNKIHIEIHIKWN